MSTCRGWLFSLMVCSVANAQLVRVPNTTLDLPPDLPASTGYALENALGNLPFDSPMAVVSVRNETNRLFVAQRGGILRMVNLVPATPVASGYLDLRDVLAAGESFDQDGENGFLSVAFHPDFAINRTLYVYFSLTVSETREAPDPPSSSSFSVSTRSWSIVRHPLPRESNPTNHY